ncbi:hypothetical protein [Ilumatobacter sp.]|uniref:hypothetical protein n=1 Tax=Ilumatobacter sp. TaxID=1967498 RepID=UPI003B51E09A
MDFTDRTLLRLTDDDERRAVLSPAVGTRILGAAFEFSNIEVGDVTGVTVRDIELLPAALASQRFDGLAREQSGSTQWEFSASLLATNPTSSAHARLELGLTTETRRADTSVERIEIESLSDLADLDQVDARIVTDDGSLPTDLDELDRRRLDELSEMLGERMTVPGDFNAELFLAARDISTLNGLMVALQEPQYTSRVELELVVDGSLPSSIQTHRVVAAAIIEPDPFNRLAELVERVQTGRAVMERSTETASPPGGMRSRVGLPYVVIIPMAALDDSDLPFVAGASPTTADAERASRLDELQRRLTPFGVALATVP